MKRIKVKQINDHIWLLNDNDESNSDLGFVYLFRITAHKSDSEQTMKGR